MQELKQSLWYTIVHPQGDDLEGCLRVVRETIQELTMHPGVIPHSIYDKGPAKNLFDDLQSLQRALQEYVNVKTTELHIALMIFPSPTVDPGELEISWTQSQR